MCEILKSARNQFLTLYILYQHSNAFNTLMINFCNKSPPKLLPYKNKYWRGTKFGELANRHPIAKFKSRQYIFSIAYQL